MAPRAWRYPCALCSKPVKKNDTGVYCKVGHHWVHCRCSSISESEYRVLQRSDGGWCCSTCEHEALPFADCSLASSVSVEATPSTASASPQTALTAAPHRSPSPPTKAFSKLSHVTFFSSNCRSLLPKMDDQRHLCHQQSPGIVTLCETWLDENVQACEVSLPDYQLFRRDRDRHGGGLALYISNSLAIRKVSPSLNYELLSAEVVCKSGLMLVAVAYRPPGTDNDLSSLCLALGSLHLAKYQRVIILGDFNVDLGVLNLRQTIKLVIVALHNHHRRTPGYIPPCPLGVKGLARPLLKEFY